MDLHPGNVMLTADGPFVIDWSNGCAGEAGADVAMAYLIMASSDVDGLPWWLTPVARGLRRLFPSRFRAAVGDAPRPHDHGQPTMNGCPWRGAVLDGWRVYSQAAEA
jgi:Phosphotransferase enzyme family